LQSIHLIQNCRKRFIFHFYQSNSTFCSFRSESHNRTNLFTYKTDSLLSENITVFHIKSETVVKILSRKYFINPFHLHCGRNIYFLYQGRCFRAFNQFRIKQISSKIYIINKSSCTADFIQSINACYIFTYIFVVLHFVPFPVKDIMASKIGV